ncbi:MAG: hypothetical protein K2Y05_06815 [Hyphomicrobiaceae bacterium]|nr:hypothetical protein [Hyphomicrobiaceae bacterium]
MPGGRRDVSLYDNGLRAAFALHADTGDHLWRMIEDVTLTSMMCCRANSPVEAARILDAWQRRATEAHAQHLGHITSVYTRMLDSHLRNLQSVIASA